MNQFKTLLPDRGTSALLLRPALLLPVLLVLAAASTSAQTSYTCFPNCDSDDGRMLLLAGVGTRTLAGDTITMKLTSSKSAGTIEVGFFDGESGGHFDNKNVELVYTLFANPDGSGTGLSQQVAQWSGREMDDNAWTSFTVANDARARAANGNYIYALRIHNPNPNVPQSWSGFKVRTDGIVSLRGYQSFGVFVPLGSELDASVIYPEGYDDFSRTTYDGSWRFYLYLPSSPSRLTVWDGDLDYGGYDCSSMDVNDPDTYDQVPSWAAGTAAIPEQVGYGLPCTDAAGTPTGGNSTGAPPDNNLNDAYSRSPHVQYRVIHPDGTEFVNDNPSGNLEWERFVISTAPFDRSEMDYHVDSLPAGIYTLHMQGMDLHNLNAWRFFDEALGVAEGAEIVGVNENGEPVLPYQPYDIGGTIYADADENGQQDDDEDGVEGITVTLNSDADSDGRIDSRRTVQTDEEGGYLFENIGPGTHTVTANPVAIIPGARAIENNGSSSVVLNSLQAPPAINFGFVEEEDDEIADAGDDDEIDESACIPIRPRSYWARNTRRWRVNQVSAGGNCYSRRDARRVMTSRRRCADLPTGVAAELIAAKINVANGNGNEEIEYVIDRADRWLRSNSSGSSRRSRYCRSNRSSRRDGQELRRQLQNYNEGRRCGSGFN